MYLGDKLGLELRNIGKDVPADRSAVRNNTERNLYKRQDRSEFRFKGDTRVVALQRSSRMRRIEQYR